MNILVCIEHDGLAPSHPSLSALSFAQSVAAATGGRVQWLLLGDRLEQVTNKAAEFAPVLVLQRPELAHPIAERHAPVIADVVRSQGADLLVAASTSQARDLVSRAAGLLGGAMVSDVLSHTMHEGELQLDRPIFAGSAIATVVLESAPGIVTVQAPAYAPASISTAPCEVVHLRSELEVPKRVEFLGRESKTGLRPDVSSAKVVVSGGRAVRTDEEFENLVGGLADVLGGAAGCSRPPVEAGIASSELQVGQTGKTVAPDLYVALGISGAVQHLSGMKHAQTIVAINNDPDAPIFDEADYGMVGDIYEIVPRIIQELKRNVDSHSKSAVNPTV